MEVKESSIDCQLHNNADNAEKLKCFSFGKTSNQNFGSVPSINNEPKDNVQKMNKRKTLWKATKVTVGSMTYAAKLPAVNGKIELYDYESFKYVKKYGIGNTIFIGYYDTKTKLILDV